MRLSGDSDFWERGDIRIVRAERTDARTLAVMRAASRRERYGDDGAKLATFLEESTVFFERALSADDGFLYAWIAYDASKPVGSVSLTIVPTLPRVGAPNAVDGRIRNVYVEPSYRRRGIAAALMREAIAQARRIDVDRLALGTSPLGRPLYESLGFVPKTDEMMLPPPGYEG